MSVVATMRDDIVCPDFLAAPTIVVHPMQQEQDNTWTASWADFWADHRIGDLVQRSGDRELASLEHQLREK